MHPLDLCAHASIRMPPPVRPKVGRNTIRMVKKHANWMDIALRNREHARANGEEFYDAMYSCQRNCESTLRVTKTNKCKSCEAKGFYRE